MLTISIILYSANDIDFLISRTKSTYIYTYIYIYIYVYRVSTYDQHG